MLHQRVMRVVEPDEGGLTDCGPVRDAGGPVGLLVARETLAGVTGHALIGPGVEVPHAAGTLAGDRPSAGQQERSADTDSGGSAAAASGPMVSSGGRSPSHRSWVQSLLRRATVSPEHAHLPGAAERRNCRRRGPDRDRVRSCWLQQVPLVVGQGTWARLTRMITPGSVRVAAAGSARRGWACNQVKTGGACAPRVPSWGGSPAPGSVGWS